MSLSILGYKDVDGAVNLIDTNIVLYAVPAGSQVIVSKILCCNTNAKSINNTAQVRISTVPPGESSDPPIRAASIFYDFELLANGAPLEIGQILLQAGSKIVVRSNKTNVNFIAYGDVQ